MYIAQCCVKVKLTNGLVIHQFDQIRKRTVDKPASECNSEVYTYVHISK